jgi:hypothetical protein
MTSVAFSTGGCPLPSISVAPVKMTGVKHRSGEEESCGEEQADRAVVFHGFWERASHS